MGKVYRFLLILFVIVCLLIIYWHELIFSTVNVDMSKELNSVLSPRYLTDGLDYDLRIIVIGCNRPNPLFRLLNSLNEADYMKDKVRLEVWLDRLKTNNLIHPETYVMAERFNFKHGKYIIFNQTRHVGIYGQWIYTWQPEKDTKEIAVILEDDLTVSPYFYKYLKNVHRKYHNHTNINGYSLNGKSMKLGGGSGFLRAPESESVFLYPVLATWGFSPQLHNWLDFVYWYNKTSQIESFVPDVPGLVTTAWYKEFMRQGKKDTMWSQWHIYHAWKKNLLTLFPSLPNYAGLATSWKDAGLHYGMTGKPDLLWTKWDSRFDDLPDNPIRLDPNGNVVYNI